MKKKDVTFLCLASYFKGGAFLEACHDLGVNTILLTLESLKDESWPWESIDEVFYMPDLYKQPDVTHAVSYLARERKIDRILALDDFDVETAASLREHLRCPGMGDTTARHFRDKLAMRVQAQDSGIKVPDFVHVLNYDEIDAYTKSVPGPWVLKPRSEAGAVGIKKCYTADELWHWIHQLGDKQSYYLIEKFIAGEVYHVDSIVNKKKSLFERCHVYGTPPFKVWNDGGVFTSKSLDPKSEDAKTLVDHHQKLVDAMGLVRGVTHAEFIKSEDDGQFYFLELAARVGGAHIDKLVEASSGINLWKEWARLELSHLQGKSFKLPKPKKFVPSGLVVCLTKDEHPNPYFVASEDLYFLDASGHHLAMVVTDKKCDSLDRKMSSYTKQVESELLAIAPPTDTVVH